MRIAICPNFEKEESLSVEKSLCALLSANGIAFYRAADDLLPDTDILCVIGGDGTLFARAPLAIRAGIPIWFINAGSVGFLAEDCLDLAERVAAVAAGRYRLDTYDLLSVSAEGRQWIAINDVCLMRDTQHLQTITLTVSSGDETVAHYRGDGALVCTALGSTGYALSADGPIMTPDAVGMAFAPISAHSLLSRPVVFGPRRTLSMQCKEGAVLFVDGVFCMEVDTAVTVCLSDAKVSFVGTQPQSFFEKISKKLL